MLPQTVEWVNLPAAKPRFLKNSAEDQRLFICRSRRLMKNLCRSSQISFTIPQKKEKNIPRSPFKHKLTLIKVSLKKVLMDKYFIYFQLLSACCVIHLFPIFRSSRLYCFFQKHVFSFASSEKLGTYKKCIGQYSLY